MPMKVTIRVVTKMRRIMVKVMMEMHDADEVMVMVTMTKMSRW
jgi:hypothetical protein